MENWVDELAAMGLPLAGLVFWDGHRIVIVTDPNMTLEQQEKFRQQLNAFKVQPHHEDIEELIAAVKAASHQRPL